MCERTKDDFTTVYQKTYTRKDGFRPEKATFEPEYKDILAGPFTEYVVPNSTIEPEHPYEQVKPCYERLVAVNPKIKRYLDSEPDEKIIARDLANGGRTVYQVDYCDIEDGFESKKTLARRRVSLPSDWGEIPATTQKASYRQPSHLATWNLRVKPIHPKRSALQPNLKEREILQVETGVSEYEGRIGALGDQVMKEQLHGVDDDGKECRKYQQMLDAYNTKTLPGSH